MWIRGGTSDRMVKLEITYEDNDFCTICGRYCGNNYELKVALKKTEDGFELVYAKGKCPKCGHEFLIKDMIQARRTH